ncbi:MAG: hypothetical protein M3P93_04380 [Actinomycetota bacterium]|nr:hypothetical protein [Actinomycetota bacterium]
MTVPLTLLVRPAGQVWESLGTAAVLHGGLLLLALAVCGLCQTTPAQWWRTAPLVEVVYQLWAVAFVVLLLGRPSPTPLTSWPARARARRWCATTRAGSTGWSPQPCS